MENKYHLQKYKGRTTRHTCPQCNNTKSFSLYVDSETGEPINEIVGRCNREDKCGYHYPPAQWFKDNPQTVDNNYSNGIVLQKPISPPKPIGIIPKEYLIASTGTESNFFQFLCSLFDADSCFKAMQHYHLGQCKDGKVIFWQIDKNYHIRTGKLMQYNPKTGKRIKCSKNAIDWVHTHLKHKGELPTDFNLKQCLFGEHLLMEYPDTLVIIVESEKSAIICSICYPEHIWLATGGKNEFKQEKLSSLRGRNVIAYPDLGGYSLWKLKAKEIKDVNIAISTLLESMATDAERKDGLDIADYLIREKLKNKELSCDEADLKV